jgi:hypothetical protein
MGEVNLYVSDAVRLMMACVTRVSTGTLNLASPTAMTFRHVAELVKSAFPFSIELKFEPQAGATTATSISQRPFDVNAEQGLQGFRVHRNAEGARRYCFRLRRGRPTDDWLSLM